MEKFPIKILIADDQPMSIHSMRLVLNTVKEFEICGVVTNGSELMIQVGRLKPDIIVTDIRMPVLDGIAATEVIKRMHPKVKVLAITQFGAGPLLLSMIKAGADGYILKDASRETMHAAIQTLMNDCPYFCPETIRSLVQLLRYGIREQQIEPLTELFFAPNEKEILQLLCEGLTSKEIATKLRLSYFTIIKYRQRLMEKTETHNVAGLIIFAIKHGLYEG